jgi:hypothetical protein
MAISLLANGRAVPARQKASAQAIAQPVVQPAKPLEIATPEWLQPILDRLVEKPEGPEDEKAENEPLLKALAQIQANTTTISQLTERLTKELERCRGLQEKVTDLQAQLVAARTQPKPAPVQTTPQWDTIRVIRGADGLMRDLKLVKE